MTVIETIPSTLVDRLRRRVKGHVLHPADAGWEDARHGFNRYVDQRPAAIVELHDAADVSVALRFAAEHGLSVAAQPVGHGATRALDGAVLLRTGRLDTLDVDVAARVARVGAGVRARDLSAALAGTGLSGLPGSSGDPTVVGYLLGGGMSWFSRRFGLAANHVRAVDLVDPEGDHIRVTGDTDAELFWALRGGGGDFGVVTAIELDLLPVGPVYGGRLTWPIERARDVLTTYSTLTATAPDELTLWALLLNVPDAEIVPEPLRGRSVVAVAATYLGPSNEAEEYLAPLRAVAPPLEDTMGTVPLERLGEIVGEPPGPTPTLDYSRLLTRFGSSSADNVLDALGEGGAPLDMIMVRHLDGELSRPQAGHGAAGTIAEPYAFVAVGIVPSPDLDAPVRASLQRMHEAVRDTTTGRAPVNTGDDASRIYPPAVLQRLRAVKRARDPLGRIRSNRPVLAGV
jgi:hypothetical protein